MICLNGFVEKVPRSALAGWLRQRIALPPDHAVFFLRRATHELAAVTAAADAAVRVAVPRHCYGLVVRRTFGIRQRVRCFFAHGFAGEVEVEVRLRLLENAAELPQRIGLGGPAVAEGPQPDEVRRLAAALGRLFQPELTRMFNHRHYEQVVDRANDPAFIDALTGALGRVLGQFKDERVLGLAPAAAIQVCQVASSIGEGFRQDESAAARLLHGAEARQRVREEVALLAERDFTREVASSMRHDALEFERERQRALQTRELAKLRHDAQAESGRLHDEIKATIASAVDAGNRKLSARITSLTERLAQLTSLDEEAGVCAPGESSSLPGQAVPTFDATWRIFAPAAPAEATPPRPLCESDASFARVATGQRFQLSVRSRLPAYVTVLALGPYWQPADGTRGGGHVEYRWLRILGDGGATDIDERPPRPSGNRLEPDTILNVPTAGPFDVPTRHYLTFNSTPGWETLAVIVTPHPVNDRSLLARLPRPQAWQFNARGVRTSDGSLFQQAASAKTRRKFWEQLPTLLVEAWGPGAEVRLAHFAHVN